MTTRVGLAKWGIWCKISTSAYGKRQVCGKAREISRWQAQELLQGRADQAHRSLAQTLASAFHCSLALRTTYSQGKNHPGDCSQSDFTSMITHQMDAIIHYRHAPEEVIGLEMATVPMMDSIKRVSTWQTRASLRRIVNCEFFRAREATTVRNMLLRAVKHSRANLHEIFPMMQQDVLIQAQNLEDTTKRYWVNFQRLREESIPLH